MVPMLSLIVSKIEKETPDAVTLTLVPQDGEQVPYQPGQFLTLVLPIRNHEIRRSFSLSSAPGIDKELQITVKRIPNGEISTWMYRHAKVGDVLSSLPPSGRFVLNPETTHSRDIFMVAAGSGITPIFSLLKSLLVHEPQSHITLIYSNRNEKSTIFYHQLNALSQKYPDQFSCLYIFSEPEDHNYPYHAHLNLELLKDLIEAHQRFERPHTEFMLCGPFAYMRMAEMIIVAMGFDKSQIHKENFLVLAEQEAINTIPVQSPSIKAVHIHNGRNDFELRIPVGKTILKTALEQGISLPYSCQGGVCGTCSAICKEGEVKMTINDVLTDKDLANGWVLTCVGYPMTDKVVLEIP